MKEIGAAVRQMRKEAGLTQEKLSELSGVSRSHIAEIEAGKYSPTVKTLGAISQACGREIKNLL